MDLSVTVAVEDNPRTEGQSSHRPPSPPQPQPPEKKPKMMDIAAAIAAGEIYLDEDDKKHYDDWDNNPAYQMTKEEEEEWEEDYNPIDIEPHLLEAYDRQVEESQGFDVNYIKGMKSWRTLITPVEKDVDTEFYRDFAQRAIDYHNQNGKDEKLELLKVLKVNLRCVDNPDIFVTFEAKDTVDGKKKTYQAQLRLDNSGTSLIIFQEKAVTSERCIVGKQADTCGSEADTCGSAP